MIRPQELTVDYLLGRLIVMNGITWRILEILPQQDRVRTIQTENNQRGDFSLVALRREIINGNITVE